MTQAEFDRLLAWLNWDPEQAGRKYEEIRHSLIKLFNWRGCSDAESWADEAINRVAARVHEFDRIFVGDPAIYFYSVAKRLFYECRRHERKEVPLDETIGSTLIAPEPEEDESALKHECLNRCVGKLDAESRKLIMAYYAEVRRDKINGRKALAEQLGISLNHLRVRVYRIRSVLEKCITKCLDELKDEMV
jgi:RNA polymerase sigma factor (sigma-70 family)